MESEPKNLPEDELAERGQAIVHAAVAHVSAPLALRERIERERARTRPARRRRRLVLGSSVAGMAAAALLVIVLASPNGTPGGPTVVQAAALAARPATEGAPRVDPARPGLLLRSVQGVKYPSWQDEFPWRASGARSDTLKGRRVVTVFYKNPAGAQLGYSIVAGKALPEPSGRSFRSGDEHYVVLTRGSRTVVTWRRGGHTCVLAAPSSVPVKRLVALASWSGETSVPS